MSKHLVLVLKLDLEHRIRQRLQNSCHYLNRVFLRQSLIPASAGLAGPSDNLYAVSTTAPSFVMATVCSKCALRLPSCVTAVQPSASTCTSGLPEFTIGSMQSTMPSRSFMPCPRRPKFGTCGSSCSEVPIPCPTNSRTTLKPSDSTTSCTAAPMSPNVAPGLTAWIPLSSEAFVTSRRRCALGEISAPTGTVMAESP